MEEIWKLMQKYYEKTGERIKLEVFQDGSGGFEGIYDGVTKGMFDDIHSIYEVLENMCK